ncbi:hypothetical protein [Saccharophagus degradans]|uniref:TPR repeat n=1 Tax=Saccharophagus degradans (strain 2-40 / ATCC 43961 / DSM 17024) TaxID=203122 RepID=Q21HZ4_SACD2|nr:hypothetical protein [Saccharophagus degradans]ABD81685.1 hypothetical protein Sde_2425 [Saccharophagus degradans 2-40]
MKNKYTNTLSRAVTIAATVLALSSCGTNAPKQDTPAFKKPLTAFDYFDMGAEQYNRWEQTEQLMPLLLAEKLFAKSLAMQPDNINIQQAHYDTLMWASFWKNDYSEQEVEAAFNALNPFIRQDVSSPAKISYARLSGDASADTLIPILFRAIQQQPRNAHTWKELSEQYAEKEHDWMAVAAAEHAVKYAPDDPENNQRLAYAINGVIESRACNFEQKPLLKRSAYYGAKAAAADKENADTAGLVGLQYLRLGLHPLAHKFAAQAYSLEQDAWNGSLLIDTYINLNKYQEAAELAQTLLSNGLKYAEPYRDFALYKASTGHWDEASLEYRKLVKKDPENIYYNLIANWLQSISNNTPLPLMLENVQLNNDWEKILYNYLTAEKAPATTPVDQAKDVCELADAHFYTAMRFWRDGDSAKTQQHLKLARKQGATWFQEHFWAGVLLKELPM